MSYTSTLEDRVRKLEQIINEGKQVGTLYHVVTLPIMKKYITKSDSLEGSAASGNNTQYHYPNAKSVIYFSRNKRFNILPWKYDYLHPEISLVGVQLVIDGDKLSNRYKLVPYNQAQFYAYQKRRYTDFDGNDSYDPITSQSEVTTLEPIKDISKYIIEIRLISDVINSGWTAKSIPAKFKDGPLQELISSGKARTILNSLDTVKEYADSHGIKLDKSFDEIYSILSYKIRPRKAQQMGLAKYETLLEKCTFESLKNKTLWHTSGRAIKSLKTTPMFFALEKDHAVDGWYANSLHDNGQAYLYKAVLSTGEKIVNVHDFVEDTGLDSEYDSYEYEEMLLANPTASEILNHPITKSAISNNIAGFKIQDYDPRDFSNDLDSVIIFNPKKSLALFEEDDLSVKKKRKTTARPQKEVESKEAVLNNKTLALIDVFGKIGIQIDPKEFLPLAETRSGCSFKSILSAKKLTGHRTVQGLDEFELKIVQTSKSADPYFYINDTYTGKSVPSESELKDTLLKSCRTCTKKVFMH